MQRPPHKKPGLWNNGISLIGLFIAVVSTAIGLPMLFLDMFSESTHPYLGALIYLFLPGVAVFGVVLTLFGMRLEWKRRRKDPQREKTNLPRIDLNRPSHQIAVMGGFFGVIIVAALLAVTGYRGYHYTESVEFCGTTCHVVMEPEYTTYLNSPHARVACVECHVGPGVDWFVRSKLSGLYQVYSTAFNKFPRPIETPVHSLRPAQQTCEQCHWPKKFFGAKQKIYQYYLPDEENTPWQIRMLMQVGGGDNDHGPAAEGIHWHMNIANKIEYIARDKKREDIPWVRATHQDGSVTVYESTEEPLSQEELAAAEIRRMDCVDCHNRPSHIYTSPSDSVNQLMKREQVDRELPYLKEQGVELLSERYADNEAAFAAIEAGLKTYYAEKYPEIAREKPEAIQDAVRALQESYSQTIFPEMKADWRVYPNHLGHMETKGCFRCHDGTLESPSGQIVTRDCNACHTIFAQGHPDALQVQAPTVAQDFIHPEDLGMDVTELNCTDCHGL